MTNRAPTAAVLTGAATGTHGGIDAAGMTNAGRSRANNEDAFLIATLQRSMLVHAASPALVGGVATSDLVGTLLVVADGMGGEGGGEVASRIAVDTVASYLLNVMPWGSSAAAGDEPTPAGVEEQLTSALLAGDAAVKLAALNSATPRMGTALSMALVFWPVLYVAHVGDTRCYLLRAGQFSRLTTDHTVAQKILEEAAEPVAPESELHHVLWNSIGGSQSLPEPQSVRLELLLGDRLLLCSDGLTKHVSDAQILALLAGGESNVGACDRLVALANAGGGSDNVTVLVADARAPLELGRALQGVHERGPNSANPQFGSAAS